MSSQATGSGYKVDWTARDRVELALPAEPELWALARMTASAVAARLDFGVDAVEDLRLAIDELCTSCAAGAGPASRLQLCLQSEGDTLRIECVVDHLDEAGSEPAGEHATSNGSDPGLPEGTSALRLSEMILAELVDEHHIGAVQSGTRRGYLEVRRADDRS
jgi:hypothetical protein